MTDPTHGPEGAADAAQEPEPSPEMLELAAKVFNLAREGGTDTLAAYVDAGIPANLSNDSGDTLVMLAAYRGHAPLAGAVFKGEREVIDALLAGGADPATGT